MGLSLRKKSNTPVAYQEAEADPGAYGTDMAFNKSAVKDFSRMCEIFDAVEEKDRKLAMQLHARNTAIGAALYGPLQSLEITLRNTINCQLISKFGVSW